MCMEKTCKSLEKKHTHTHTQREGVRWWGSQCSSLTKQICSSLQGCNSLQGSSLHPNRSQMCEQKGTIGPIADWGLHLNYAVTVTLGNVHKSANDRCPGVTDSLTLIHFPPGGKHTAQTVLHSCSLPSDFLILFTHLAPHIVRPLTARIN